ncbi:NAD-dependent epimerase/dehydratase family protein, partial [Actinoplanes siamensis]
MTHLLVTGGAGFIGSHITAALLAANHDVSVLDCVHPAAHVRPVQVPTGVRL